MLLKMLNRNTKGFGLIELIVVMGLISIIVLFATPKFSHYFVFNTESKLTAEVQRVEYEVKKIMLKSGEKWNKIADTDIVYGDLWTSTGRNKEKIDGELLEVPLEFIDSNLPGRFYLNEGKIFYSDTKLPTTVLEEDIPPPEPDYPREEVNKDYLLQIITIAESLKEEDYEFGWYALEKSLSNATKVYGDPQVDQIRADRAADKLQETIDQLVKKQSQWVVADDSDFIWVKDNFGYSALGKYYKGYFKYIGTKEYLIIPEFIQGTKITNYRKMFIDNKVVKGVSNTTKNITSASMMFYGANLVNLDVSGLQVDNVIYLSRMFNNAHIEECLNLEGWDTSKAIYMDDMFYKIKVGQVNLSGFNTSNTYYMTNMFRKMKTDEIDISSFSFLRTAYLGYMFEGIKINKIYVKNADIKKKIVKEGFAPSNKVFIKE